MNDTSPDASPWWTPHIHADRRPRLMQRNAIAERILGLPHDTDVEAGTTWAESRSARRPA